MANDLTRLPIVLDSTMSSTFRNSSPGWGPLSIYPLKIYWFNPVNIGDTFVIADAAGKTLFEGRCEVANQSQYFDIAANTKWFDWQLNTIGSGKIELWYKT